MYSVNSLITTNTMQCDGNPGKRYDTWNDVHMVLFHRSVLTKEYVCALQKYASLNLTFHRTRLNIVFWVYLCDIILILSNTLYAFYFTINKYDTRVLFSFHHGVITFIWKS